MNNIKQFFDFAKERQNIFLKRQSGQRSPWTEDPVLQRFRFCNVFREDDRTTIWFRENIREPLRNDPKVLMATVIFRWFNRIETGKLIKEMLFSRWNRNRAFDILDECRQARFKVFTGAYIIKSPNGKQKLEGILDCIDTLDRDAHTIVSGCCHNNFSLRELHAILREYPYLGPFMAYEVITDLRHTYLLEKAKDINSWASAGPGCARGLGWLVCDNPERYNYQRLPWQERMLIKILEVLDYSRDPSYWPAEWPKWEMREVEHTLCEYDKWRRGHEGEKLKRMYHEGH